MPRYFLTDLQIEGFRGINNEGDPLRLRFKEGAVNSVFGPNGFGKSSTYDALCYAVRGDIPKLRRLQAAEQADEYFCNRFHGTGRGSIRLALKPDDGGAEVVVLVERDRAGNRTVTSPSGYADPEGLLRSLNEDFVLLDYDSFRRFVEDSALERGRTFAGLLGLSALSEHRQALEMLSESRTLNTDLEISAYERQRDASQAAATNAEQRIAALYQRLVGEALPLGTEPAEIVANATAALRKAPLLAPFLEEADVMTADIDAMRQRVREEEGGTRRDRLALVIQAIGRLDALAPAGDEVGDQERLAASVAERDEALAGTRGPLFQTMYQSVHAVLTSEQWEEKQRCPACESLPEVPADEHVASQLAFYEAVQEKQGAIRACAEGPWLDRLRRLEEEPELDIGAAARIHAGLRAACLKGGITTEAVAAASSRLAELDAWREGAQARLQAERQTIEAELPESLVALTEKVEATQQLRAALDERGEHTATAAIAGQKASRRKNWKAFITKACATFSEAEAALSTAVTTSLEDEYKAMFAHIMGADAVVPQLQRAARTENLSLRLEAFHGAEGLAATPLLSESYRNALAISLFLSAALRSKGAARFIVLDDITSSFDAGHQFYLMEVLRTRVGLPGNPAGLQVILLSHDGLLEKYFDRLGGTPEWNHQKLLGWPPLGNVITQAQDNERLKAQADRFLRAGQVKEAEPLIRQYLEYKLLQVIAKVRIPVPLDFAIKDHLHMVQNCLDIIREAMTLYDRAGALVLGSVLKP